MTTNFDSGDVTAPPPNTALSAAQRLQILTDALKSLSSSWRHDAIGHVPEKYLSIELAERGLVGVAHETIDMAIQAGVLASIQHVGTSARGYQIHWDQLDHLTRSTARG